LVTNVSDTARWVAQYRAIESARGDALFRDHLAARLAGPRGRAIVAAAPQTLRSGWSVVARTKLIDDLVATAVADGCDCVINLAAGLDTRPYRLPLPASLTWIEADLPAIVHEKERKLAGERASCTVVREAIDLSEPGARWTFLARAVGERQRALVITEGLLPYLDDGMVRSLAHDLAARRGIRWWILDVLSPGALATLKGTRGHLAAPMMNFAPADGVGFFEALGWRTVEVHSIVHAAARFRRAPLRLRPLAWLPDPDPRRLGHSRWSGVARLARV
jgi:methyltransferase (TIGR00027 family)